jgi:hypothetical protein
MRLFTRHRAPGTTGTCGHRIPQGDTYVAVIYSKERLCGDGSVQPEDASAVAVCCRDCAPSLAQVTVALDWAGILAEEGDA